MSRSVKSVFTVVLMYHKIVLQLIPSARMETSPMPSREIIIAPSMETRYETLFSMINAVLNG